jgi:carbonic anhydrase/acetyltransferase-like protein (isoleucine patch superfamily)
MICGGGIDLPIYSLDGVSPKLPEEGRYWIAPDANIIGKVELAEDTSVWFGTTVRGDNEWIRIGARTNLQDLCVLHTDMGLPLEIGPDCTIGHRVILHSCTIGANSLIGMGATILSGAKIGRNCLVGANALVTERKEFPNNSLIKGAPAKIVHGWIEPEGSARLIGPSMRYVANSQRFAKGLKRVDP